jgi:hypothetical protein
MTRHSSSLNSALWMLAFTQTTPEPMAVSTAFCRASLS